MTEPSRRAALGLFATVAVSACTSARQRAGTAGEGSAAATSSTPEPIPIPTVSSAGPGDLRGFVELEASAATTIGVSVLDTSTGRQRSYRGDERFPMCSTHKVLNVAAVLRTGQLSRLVSYAPADLQTHSPVTTLHVNTGMTRAQLCDAAIRYSDNTAANLLIQQVGGPTGVTAFVRSIGDSVTRLDRVEPDLNAATPGDVRDTTMPDNFVADLQRIATTGPLYQWMLGNTTGAGHIRAAVPAGWAVADKTGSGSYGMANDVAVIGRPGRPPLLLSVFTRRSLPDVSAVPGVIAGAARLALSQI